MEIRYGPGPEEAHSLVGSKEAKGYTIAVCVRKNWRRHGQWKLLESGRRHHKRRSEDEACRHTGGQAFQTVRAVFANPVILNLCELGRSCYPKAGFTSWVLGQKTQPSQR